MSTRQRARRGLTLVELVLAAGLLALLLAAVFKLIQQFMTVWERSELRRAEVEEASGVAELCALDLDALEPGPRGDMLAEWAMFDHDGDGVAETKWPRVRLVRHASPAELARLQAGEAREERLAGQGLIEVTWAVLPAFPGTKERDLRPLGQLWRGERIAGPARGADVSMFDDKYLGLGGAPRPGSTQEVTSGVLWFGMQFATQTTVLRDGWKLGAAIGDSVANWDAWRRKRPDASRHFWNDESEFLPTVSDAPLLPRRALLEFEIERPSDFKRRTRVRTYFGQQDGTFEVDDGTRLPEVGAFVRIDYEWLKITDKSGRTVSVRRGQRATTPAPHDAGALVHFGRTTTREVPIATHREDWGL
ncbi:MAG: hypothetical protein IT454_08260 [Planctomycetes bacterium]|nr:hypothetical protein [Planctomycetota bacterium]